jgi:hypothetical protein
MSAVRDRLVADPYTGASEIDRGECVFCKSDYAGVDSGVASSRIYSQVMSDWVFDLSCLYVKRLSLLHF